MVWRTFEKTQPRDGQHILILTRGCSSSAAEGFYIKATSVEKYHNSGLISEKQFEEIENTKHCFEIAAGYGHNTSLPSYYVIVPIFSGYEEEVWINCESFKWIPFPDDE